MSLQSTYGHAETTTPDVALLIELAREKIGPAYGTHGELVAAYVAGSTASARADSDADLEVIFYWKKRVGHHERLACARKTGALGVGNAGWFEPQQCDEEKLVIEDSSGVLRKVDCMHFNVDVVEAALADAEAGRLGVKVQIVCHNLQSGIGIAGDEALLAWRARAPAALPLDTAKQQMRILLYGMYQQWRWEVPLRRGDLPFLYVTFGEAVGQVL